MRQSPSPADRSWPGPPHGLAPVATPAVASPAVRTAGGPLVASDNGAGHHTTDRPRPSPVIGRFRGTVVVTLHGDLDLAASVRLAGVFRDLIEGQDNVVVVVDLWDVARIRGPGVDVLASAGRRMEERGGDLRLARATGPAADALAAAGLARFLSARPEQVPRDWSANRRAGDASRRAGVRAHPAAAATNQGHDDSHTSRFWPTADGNSMTTARTAMRPTDSVATTASSNSVAEPRSWSQP